MNFAGQKISGSWLKWHFFKVVRQHWTLAARLAPQLAARLTSQRAAKQSGLQSYLCRALQALRQQRVLCVFRRHHLLTRQLRSWLRSSLHSSLLAEPLAPFLIFSLWTSFLEQLAMQSCAFRQLRCWPHLYLLAEHLPRFLSQLLVDRAKFRDRGVLHFSEGVPSQLSTVRSRLYRRPR